ncbi:serine hydrolase domain-containing protein [Chryseobacterium gwangjuense]|uniref:serine hydrolase domain-containing protein n=1 Tax=Chryseobacterium gwangjuense TaxID=1069980 RepID=UPI001E59B191|nr:serine hydrolase domain-containing protein [Chryseobacterium gwangjuense]MCE3076013.1 beta-lactamase family protein [Chryseobacterium gwangjuense]
MSQKFKLFSFFFIILFSNFSAQTKFAQKIDSLITSKVPRTFNGVILITKNGKTQYSKAYGFQNVNTKTPLKLNDQFEIMSNTKQITSVLLLKEVEKGKVNLQSPIKKYLPNLTQTWADSVTVHQLLNHTHGIADLEKPLLFKPGSDFKYGNLSNILLGKIIETVSHEAYSKLANKLFQQLGMKETFCYSKENRRNLVSGHMSKDNTFTAVQESFINDENLPADGVITTAKDLSIWNNQLHKGKILSSKMYQLMTTPSTLSQHDVFSKDKMGYGYNIRIIKDHDIQYFGHTGLGDGFASLNIYVPSSDVSIIVLENQMNENGDLYYYFETEIKKIILNSNLIKK